MKEFRPDRMTPAHFEQILNALSDFVSVHDMHMRVVAANRPLLEYLGKELHEIIGLHCHELFLGSPDPWPRCPDRRARETGKPATEEILDPRTGASLLVTASPLLDDGGKLTGTIQIARHHRGGASESLYRQLVESTSAVPWEVDLASLRFTYVGPQATRIFGYPPEKWTDFHFWVSLVHPDDRAQAVNFCQDQTARGKDHDFEYRALTSDGRTRWIRDFVTVVKKDGQPVSLRGFLFDITDRKTSEENLALKDERFRNFFHGSSVSLWEEDISEARAFIDDLVSRGVTDLGNYLDENPDVLREIISKIHVVDVNKASLRLYGAERKEELVDSFGKIFPPESHEALKDLFVALAEKKVRFSAATVNHTLDGRKIRVLISISIPSPDSAFRNMLVTVMDITDRFEVMESLRKRERQLADSQRVARLGSWEWDIARDSSTWSDGLYRLLGLEPGRLEASYDKFMNFVHPDDRVMVDRAIRESLRSRRSCNIDARGIRENGEEWAMQVIGKATYDESGTPVLMGGTVQDITVRKNIEEDLRESKSRIAKILSTSHEGFWLINNHGETIDVNDAMCAMMKESREELIGKNLRSFLDEESQSLFSRQLRPPSERRSGAYEGYLRRPDGTGFPCLVNATQLISGSGRKIGSFAMITDLSEIKKTEEELHKMKRLESIGVLAGGIAHDFNNLLTALFGHIELARMDLTPGNNAYDHLVEAGKAFDMATHLTSELLTFSEGGKPITESVRVESLIGNMVNLALSGSKVRSTVDNFRGLWPAEIDKGQMRQVFHNLLLNAKEAMPSGGEVKITTENVTLYPRDPLPLREGRYVKISVADNGQGMEDEVLPLVFDPYFTTKERGAEKGRGLGLAICHSIVKKHGGHIEVESVQGKGSIFVIYLPASEQPVTPSVGLKDGPVEHAASGNRILLLEDEQVVTKVALGMLQHLGYEVVCTSDGLETIAVFRKAEESGLPFDLAILDLTIRGGMGGIEAVRNLQEINPDVKAIVASGFAEDPVMADFEAYGFKAAIAKPYSIKSLGEVIAKILGNQ